MIYTAIINLRDDINRESFRKALKDTEERYSDFGGIPIVFGKPVDSDILSVAEVNILNIIGLCKSTEWDNDNFRVTFELNKNYQSQIISEMIRKNVPFKLSPRMIRTKENNNYLINSIICIDIKSV
jgi:hypothetical protein